MKLILTGDIHFGYSGKLDDSIWAMERMVRYAKNNGIDTIIILGDLFHDRTNLRVDVLVKVYRFFEQHSDIRFITYCGNHDLYLKNSWDINSLEPLRKLITVVPEIDSIVLDGRKLWIMPFMYYESEYMEALHEVETAISEDDILLTHIGVKSSILNSCFLLQSWSLVDFTDSKFKQVYTGHFHVHQQVGHNVWYPGSPIPFKFDEGDVDHGFMVLDLQTNIHEFVSIWDGVEHGDGIPPQYATLSDEAIDKWDQNEIKGNIVRIALSKEYSHNRLSEIKDIPAKFGAREVRFMHLNIAEPENIKAAKNLIADTGNLFEQFTVSDDLGKLNKKLLAKLNAEIVADGDRKYYSKYE